MSLRERPVIFLCLTSEFFLRLIDSSCLTTLVIDTNLPRLAILHDSIGLPIFSANGNIEIFSEVPTLSHL